MVAKEGITATPLAKTSEAGRSIQGYYNLMPNAPIPPDAESQAYTVAVALEGKFKSFYAGKEIPPIPTAADTVDTAENETPVSAQDAQARTTKTESETDPNCSGRHGTIPHAATSRWSQLFLKHRRLANSW